MPTYKITDPLSGKMLKVTGDSPPSEDELSQLFAPYTPHQGPEIPDTFAGKQAVSDTETGDPNKAYWDSLKDTGSKFLKGAASNLNPMNIARGVASAAKLAAPVILPGPLSNQMFSEEARNVGSTFKRIAQGDPEAGGQAVGGLLMGKFAPELASAAPPILKGAGVATEMLGKGTEAVGKMSGRIGRQSIIPAAITGHPVGAIVAAATPPLIRAGGRGLQAVGRGAQSVAGKLSSMMEDVPLRDAVPVEGQVMSDGFGSGRGDFVPDAEFSLAPQPELPPHRPSVKAGPVPPESNVSPDARWQGGDLPARRPAPEAAIEGELVTDTPEPTGPVEAPPSSLFGSRSLPAAGETSGPFEMPVSSIEDQLQRWQEPESVTSYSKNPTAELGMPRVKQWKDGKGPTAAEVQRARQYGGSKDAASRLRIPQKRVLELAPQANGELPLEAQQRLRTAVKGMSPEQARRYASQAKNPKAQAFIESLLQ